MRILFLKSKWRSRLLEVLVLLLVVLAIREYMQRDAVTGPAPALSAMTLDGQLFDLAKQQGQPVLIHFWASWCGICSLQEDSINAIARDHNVITVAMQSGSDLEVKNHLATEGLGFSVINDEDGELSRSYGVRGVPTTFIVDDAGQIRFTEVGYSTETGLRLRLWWLARNPTD